MTVIRIQKFLSEQGITSRRQAEVWIKGGHVTVNSKAAKLGNSIDPDKDIVKVFGKLVKVKKDKIYVALNKPKGYVCSKKDPQGRKTIFSLLPPDIRNKVWNIGRLDFNTEGLIILTNDGELTQQLAHPKYEHDKEYEVITNLPASAKQLEKLRTGVKIATGLTYPAKIKTRNSKIFITIHEGKKRQIRRMIAAVGLEVKNLKRIRINNLKLPKIAPGEFKFVTKQDIL